MGTVYPLQYCSWVWPKTATIYLHFVFLDYLFFQPQCQNCHFQFQSGNSKMSHGCHPAFSDDNAKSAEFFLVVKVDRLLRTSCLQMRQQTHEVWFYPSLCWSAFYRCLFQLHLEVVVSISKILLLHQAPIRCLQFCPFLVQMPSKICLRWTLNSASNPIWSNTEETIVCVCVCVCVWVSVIVSDRIFVSIIGASTSLFLPLHTWRMSSVTVHFSPSTESPSLLGSTSTCFVLLIDFKSSGIASITVSFLLIHFFDSNPCCERRGCSWLNTSIASTRISADLMKSSM